MFCFILIKPNAQKPKCELKADVICLNLSYANKHKLNNII